MRLFSFLRAVSCAALLLLPAAPLCLAAKGKIKFNVKAQSLPIALMIFARQADMEVLFSYHDLNGLQAPAVAGELTPDQALELMLKDSGYFAMRRHARSIQILSPIAVAQAMSGVTRAPASGGTVSRKETVTQLENYVVTGKKDAWAVKEAEKTVPLSLPVGDASAERPRSANDSTPSVIFDGAALEKWGAHNVSDFLATRLPSSAAPSHTGDVGLRGQGGGYTRLFVNGREFIDGAKFHSINPSLAYQTSNLNLLPLSSIQRIEVLPMSSTGTFGGGAVGGVVNVVTKRDYTGGEVTIGYENSFNSDTAGRRAELRYGLSLDEGRTRVMLYGGVTDSNALAVQDRYDLIRDYAARVTTGNSGLFTGVDALLGTTPRVDSANGAALVLKNGDTLGSKFVYLPAGYRGWQESGTAGLVAKAGKLDPEWPDTGQAYIGRRLLLDSRPKTQSLRAEIRRLVTPSVEAFLNFSYENSLREEDVGLFSSATELTVPVGVPSNPFGQEVKIRFPYTTLAPHESSRWHRSVTGGFLLSLPKDWNARLEHTRNYSRAGERLETANVVALKTAINEGTLDVFQDFLQNPGTLADFRTVRSGKGSIESVDSFLRMEGPLPALFSIRPTILFGARFRKEGRDLFEIFDEGSKIVSGLLPGSQSISSYFGELTVPMLTAEKSRVGLRQLELQLGGRRDKYNVKSTYVAATGTQLVENMKTPTALKDTSTNYSHEDPTYAIRYKPVDDVMLRVSFSTAFLPFADSQLLPRVTTTGTITDPKRGGAETSAKIISGGSSNLDPEKSENWSAGAVFAPRNLPGLRMSVDYTSMRKWNTVDILSPQTILKYEGELPGRVTRGAVPEGDTFSVGPVTEIDASLLNFYSTKLAAWDVSLGYKTNFSRLGTFDLSALVAIQPRFDQQLVPGGPMLDLVNSPLSAGPLRERGNTALVWSRGPWSAGWAVRYYGGYKQATLGLDSLSAQLLQPSGQTISSQVFHDVFVGYQFSRGRNRASTWIGDTEMLVGVRNLFDAEPEFEANSPSGFFLSRYSDLRMVSYYLSLKRGF